MSAHTPGPWEWDGNTLRPANLDPSRSAVHSILDAEGGYGFLGSDRHATSAELDADRRLIAAAPELLAELKNLLKVCVDMDAENDNEKPTEAEYIAAIQSAAKAIFRAEDNL
jgi:hypothetical protein